MMVASTRSTSFPRRREPQCACAATIACSVGASTDLDCRLRGIDGVTDGNDVMVQGSLA